MASYSFVSSYSFFPAFPLFFLCHSHSSSRILCCSMYHSLVLIQTQCLWPTLLPCPVVLWNTLNINYTFLIEVTIMTIVFAKIQLSVLIYRYIRLLVTWPRDITGTYSLLMEEICIMKSKNEIIKGKCRILIAIFTAILKLTIKKINI